MNDVRVRVEQLNPSLGDLHRNLDLHLEAIERARTDGVELLVFPELSLTGYFLKDQTSELARSLEDPEIQALIEQTADLTVVVGFVERSPSGALYNSAAWMERGEVRHVHRKVHLVSYGMFDEERDFAAGTSYSAVESRFGRFGLLICEDVWHLPGAYSYFLDEVDGLIIPSASPGRGVLEHPEGGLRSVRTWNRILSTYAMLTQSFVAYANRVGFEDGVAFGGGSSILGPDGEPIVAVEGLDPGHADGNLRSAALRRARVATPLRRDERPWILSESLGRRSGDGRLPQ